MAKLKIKKGDSVVMLSGDDKGKTGKVLSVFPKAGTVLVEGMNMVKRHERKKRNTGKGQVIEKSLPVNISNVAIADPKSGKPTRVGRTLDEKKKQLVRVAKKSGTTL